MDELELLKKDWQKGNIEYPKLSRQDIFPMLLKKSSSIVKILFYISIAELLLWLFINLAPLFFSDDSMSEQLNSINMSSGFANTITIISTAIVFIFVFLLYKSYKSISVTDNSKKLMENILRTRKTVKQYVGVNIIIFMVTFIYTLSATYKSDPSLVEKIDEATADVEIFKYYAVIIIGTIIVLAITVGLFLLIYWLIYGLLLNKLNKNYRELKKLEA